MPEEMQSRGITGGIEMGALERLWKRFVTEDMALPRSYPEVADAFVGGYRLSSVASSG